MPRAKLGGDSNRGHGGVDGAPTKSTAATDDAPAAPGHLGALSTLFFAEMWERFSYYGMRALLTLFMVAPADAGGLAFATADAALVYGNYTMAVYLLAIPGGFIADRLLGARASVLVGGAIIAAGHFALAVPHIAGFYIGLMLVALGTGPFKPAISSLVGSLYTREDPRRDAGFSIFYMGINLGALIAPLVTGYLAQNATFKSWLAANGFDPAHSWHWGFGAAGIGMSFALAVLWMRRDRLPGPPADLAEERAGAYRQGAAVLAASAILLSGLLLSDLDGFRWLR
ncbi:MAG: peptide MFS transporter, partial [Hyphomicrobiaceae bacterium]